jgi:hypothetical protein
LPADEPIRGAMPCGPGTRAGAGASTGRAEGMRTVRTTCRAESLRRPTVSGRRDAPARGTGGDFRRGQGPGPSGMLEALPSGLRHREGTGRRALPKRTAGVGPPSAPGAGDGEPGVRPTDGNRRSERPWQWRGTRGGNSGTRPVGDRRRWHPLPVCQSVRPAPAAWPFGAGPVRRPGTCGLTCTARCRAVPAAEGGYRRHRHPPGPPSCCGPRTPRQWRPLRPRGPWWPGVQSALKPTLRAVGSPIST